MMPFHRFPLRLFTPFHQHRLKIYGPVTPLFFGGAVLTAALFLWLHEQPHRIIVHPSERTVDLTLAQGESLHAALTRVGLDPATILDIDRALRPLVNPRRVPAGQSLRLFFDLQEDRITGLEYPLKQGVISLKPTPHGWLAERREDPL